MQNYRHLDTDQIKELQLGDTVYMAGWPMDQDFNKPLGNRQEFALSVLGTERVHIAGGEVMELLWATTRSSVDGAECSFGASGSEGFVMLTSVDETTGESKTLPYSVGTLAAFAEFKPDTYIDNQMDADSTRVGLENYFWR